MRGTKRSLWLVAPLVGFLLAGPSGAFAAQGEPALPSSGNARPEGAANPPAGSSEHGTVEGGSDVATRASSIARRTMSPFCPGRTLADCPSNYAAEWRQDIREMVARGMSAAEIQAELSRRAGGDLSGIPNRDVSYALPLGIGAAAAVVLALVLLRLRRNRRAEASADAAEPSSPEHAAEATAPVDDARLASELEAEADD